MLRLPGDRDRVRQFAVISALNLLRLRLLERDAVEACTPSERLFVAVWPPDDVLDLLAGLPGRRWLESGGRAAAQWHVTLRFLGDAEVDAVRAALGGVRAA